MKVSHLKTYMLFALACIFAGCEGCSPTNGQSCESNTDCQAGETCTAKVCTVSDGGTGGGTGGAGGGNAGGQGGGNTGGGQQQPGDSDCDGIMDADELNGTYGCNLDPANPDSDLDGLVDGLEVGVVGPGPDSSCMYEASTFDTNPATTTNPCQSDSDGDGVFDGVEDSNRNGNVDPEELDPNNATDGEGPTGKACSQANLRPVTFQQNDVPDIQLALSSGFDSASGGELATITLAGVAKGLMGYDATGKVAFIALTQPAPTGSTNPTDDEVGIRAILNSKGLISTPTSQTFSTWDGHFGLVSTYAQAGTADLKTQANELAIALLGTGAGALTGTAGVTGPFTLQAEYVHRSDQALTMVIALTPTANFVEPTIFTVKDTAGGSALAAFPDATEVQCEPFTASNQKVDFLFSVDDSASMPDKQQALADVANLMEQKLNNSSLDWRIAMVGTSYFAAPLANSNHGVIRGFTRDIKQFQAWMTKDSICMTNTCTKVTPAPACNSNGPAADGRWGGCWIGAGGIGNVAGEAILGVARKAIDDLTPAVAPEQIDRIREGAQVVVVMVGDADDQTTGYATSAEACGAAGKPACEPVKHFVDYFLGTGLVPEVDKNELGKRIVVHGIMCSDGENCGETQSNPRRDLQVIAATGGVVGNIIDSASIQVAMDAIMQSIIGGAGKRLQRPPIGASIKVALAAVQTPAMCTQDDLPRSRVNGFDFDALNRTISLYGACRAPEGTAAAVSYRAWVKKTSTGCMPINCGGPCAQQSYICNTATCICEPGIN